MTDRETQELTLTTICGGATEERFRAALAKVVENIQDPNTEAEKVREINLRFAFKPHESRELAQLSVACTTKTAPAKPLGELTFFGQERGSGKLVATRRDPQQLELDEKPDESTVVPISKNQQKGA